MISKINNTVTLRANSTELKDNEGKFNKNSLQKFYEDAYKRDVKVNNSFIALSGIGGIFCLIGSIISKNSEYKLNLRFASIGGLMGALVAYLLRPKKEKYNEQVQIELRKENI